jgi:hypothetical protein
MEVPKKVKIELLYDPTILCLVIYPKEPKSPYSKDVCIPMFISVHNSQIMQSA